MISCQSKSPQPLVRFSPKQLRPSTNKRLKINKYQKIKKIRDVADFTPKGKRFNRIASLGFSFAIKYIKIKCTHYPVLSAPGYK